MLISPEGYAAEMKNKTYEELLTERDFLFKEIRMFEMNLVPRESFDSNPFSKTDYYGNLLYLGELLKLIAKKYDEDENKKNEENTYDHINEYLTAEINDPNAPEIRKLISDFAILWNLYENNIYGKSHHIRLIKEKIEEYNLDKMYNVDLLYKKLKSYVFNKHAGFNYNVLKEWFNIRVLREKDGRIVRRY